VGMDALHRFGIDVALGEWRNYWGEQTHRPPSKDAAERHLRVRRFADTSPGRAIHLTGTFGGAWVCRVEWRSHEP